ncbi:MAG: DM13 domain-containing protein [Pseudomonadota bacterium]
MKTLFRLIIALNLVLLVAVHSQAQTIKSGTIRGASVSWTTGSASIVKAGNRHELRLGSNFKTKSGPSLWVYLGNNGPEKRIGKLKSINGAQTYKLPASINPKNYSKVYIHCVPFNATFGIGMLN